MATKKKTTTAAAKAEAGKNQNTVPEETAKTILDPDASTAEKLEALQGMADNLPEPETAKGTPEQEAEPERNQNVPEETAKEPEPPEPITKDMPCPFEATVSVALAVLRKASGIGTAEMLKPVATMKQGTKVTVKAVKGEDCLLRNGLWIATEYLTKQTAVED